MINYLRCSRYLFSVKPPRKPWAENPSFKQKLAVMNEMKAYIIPFLHPNPLITKALMKAYGYLCLSKVCFFGGPMLLKFGINSLQSVSMADPFLFFFGYGILYSASVLFESMRNIQVLNVTNLALVETATKAYTNMLSMGPGFFFKDSQQIKLFNIYKAKASIEENIKAFTQYFLPFFLDVGICSALLVHYADPWAMCAFLACYMTYSTFTIRYSEYRRKHIVQQRETQRKMTFTTSEAFANYYNIKYFKKERFQIQKYKKSLEESFAATKKAQISLGILNTVQRVIFGAGLTFNLLVGAYYVQKGLMSTGDIVMIQTLMMQFLTPLFFLGSTYRNFIDTFPEVRQLYDTIHLRPEVIEGNYELSEVKGNICFKDVTFRYITNAEVVQKISFQIKPGEFFGIVGESGSGKTTILNLIFRLFDPSSGEITLDGHNLKDIKFSFRNHITFISQQPYLFNGTVLQNLQYGHDSCSIEEIEEYTKALGLHQVIMSLPNGYLTNVGEKGNIFSGGEKQRLSIIRGLLKKTPILLLDEPTSSLDQIAEEKVMNLLNNLKDTTKIMITHREGLLKHMDKLIMIKKSAE